MNKRQKQVYDFLAAKNTWMSAKDIAQEVFGDEWEKKLIFVGLSLNQLELKGLIEMRRVPVSGRSDRFEYRVK